MQAMCPLWPSSASFCGQENGSIPVTEPQRSGATLDVAPSNRGGCSGSIASRCLNPATLPRAGPWEPAPRRSAAPGSGILQRRGQVRGVEIGPHPPREHQLRVGAFPQQEVAQPLLAAGADQQVHRRPQARSPATRAKAPAARAPPPGSRPARSSPPRCAAAAPAPPAVARSASPMAAQQFAAQAVAPPDHLEADAVLQAASRLRAPGSTRTAASGRRLPPRAAPVVGGEGEQREHADARIRAPPPPRGAPPRRRPVSRQARQPPRRAQRPLPSMMIPHVQSTL